MKMPDIIIRKEPTLETYKRGIRFFHKGKPIAAKKLNGRFKDVSAYIFDGIGNRIKLPTSQFKKKEIRKIKSTKLIPAIEKIEGEIVTFKKKKSTYLKNLFIHYREKIEPLPFRRKKIELIEPFQVTNKQITYTLPVVDIANFLIYRNVVSVIEAYRLELKNRWGCWSYYFGVTGYYLQNEIKWRALSDTQLINVSAAEKDIQTIINDIRTKALTDFLSIERYREVTYKITFIICGNKPLL